MQGNEEAWASTFPVGLKYGDTERGPVHKLGGIPPIRLVPPVHEADESEATVTIKLTNKAKDTYIKFTGGNPEAAVRHVKLFYSLVDKMELRLQYETKQEALKTNRVIL
jgi:organic radical activating enzyme